jgi:HEAT repeat protein
MKHFFVLIVAISLVTAGAAFGQSDGEPQGGEQTIEELYLSQDIELQIIRGQALSNDRELKFLALQSIRASVEDGALTEDNPGLFIILESLATEGTARQVRSEGAIINRYPEIRRQSAQLLGEIGGKRSQQVLLTILQEDPEPMVLAEAVYALGTIGINDDNETLNHIVFMLRRENAREAPDNNLAFASLLAMEKIATSQGGISDPDAINVVLEVAAGSYVRDVRLKAIDVINKLRGRG